MACSIIRDGEYKEGQSSHRISMVLVNVCHCFPRAISDTTLLLVNSGDSDKLLAWTVAA